MIPHLLQGIFLTGDYVSSHWQKSAATKRQPGKTLLFGNTSTNTEKAAAVILGLYYEPKTFH